MSLRSRVSAMLNENQRQAIRRVLYGTSDNEGDDGHDGPAAPRNWGAIAWFDRHSVAIEDLPSDVDDATVDVNNLYSAFRRYRNYERAELCAQTLVRRDASVANRVKLSRALLDLNRPAEVCDSLEAINPVGLSHEASRQVHFNLASAMRLMRRHDEALAMTEEFVALSPGSTESRLLLIEMLEDLHRHNEVEAHFDLLLSTQNPTGAVLAKHLDWLYTRQRFDDLESRLQDLLRSDRRSPAWTWRMSRLHWLTGNEVEFNRATRNAIALMSERIPPAGALSFYTSLSNDESAWTAVGEFRRALEAQLHGDLLPLGLGRPHGPDWTLNRLAAATYLENHDHMSEYAGYLLREFSYIPQAYTAKAIVETYRGRYDEADSLLDRGCAYDRTHPDLYSARFEIELLRSGNATELGAILAERDQHVRKFNEYLPDGRMRYYDRDRHALHRRTGDYVAAFKMHAGQVHNRFLANRFPKSYRSADFDLFERDESSIAIVGQDGVADEIRWAQYLPSLLDRHDGVSLTCDPRLASLFARSFPEVELRGLRRYPLYFPRIGCAGRSTVDQVHVSAKVDDQLLTDLANSGRIVLPEEIAVQQWVAAGTTGPAPSDVNLNCSYLVPDSERVKYWGTRLKDDMGDALKVGIVWRSQVGGASREKHFLDVTDYDPLLGPEVAFLSLQPNLSSNEAVACLNRGIRIYGDIDLYDDFESIAALVSNLDLIIGISSVSFELGAAVGTECWLVTPAPFGRYSRADPKGSNRDLMTANTSIFHGDLHEYELGKAAVIQRIFSTIEPMLRAKVSQRTRSFGELE